MFLCCAIVKGGALRCNDGVGSVQDYLGINEFAAGLSGASTTAALPLDSEVEERAELLGLAELVRIMKEASAGLVHLHAKGVIHR